MRMIANKFCLRLCAQIAAAGFMAAAWDWSAPSDNALATNIAWYVVLSGCAGCVATWMIEQQQG